MRTARSLLLLLLLALVVLPDVCTANPYGDEDEDEDEDEELLVVGDHRDSDEDERLEGLHDAAGGATAPPTPTSEIEDPLDGIIDAALNSPAIFAQRLKVNFEGGAVEEIHLKRGDKPMEVVKEFAELHDMEDDQAQLTARALARAQLEGAYASELDRRAVDDQALARPALFNLSLAVRESDEDDEDDDGLKIHISAGQTPLDATNAFVEASDVPISTEVARKIAVRLLEDQRALAWDVASEQFSENVTVLSYLQARLVALNRAELESLQAAITKRISELLLFTLYVECDGCADVDGLGPMPVHAHEGDNVEDLTNEAAVLAGRVDDELWISRVRGAIIVTFHNYKQLREELAAQEGKPPTSENPSTYWYDQRSDSFKEPRAWEDTPPREPPLFQISYEVDSPKSEGYPVNVTIYEGDIAIDVGAQLAEYYEIEPKAGHSFAHYAATSFRKVRNQLNLTIGVRPWEEEAPDGMPLFRVDLATIEGLDEEGEVVVHEGDGPKALAKAALRYYREQRQEGCAADGSGKAGGLLNGAAVGEKYDGVCVSDTPEEIKLKVGLLSRAITKRFNEYFG